jgi:hypothetical protein
MTRSWLLSDSCEFVDAGRSLWWEDGSVVCNCCWPLPAQSFSRPYFAVSDLRLPFSSPPATRRAAVDVFDPPPHGIELNSKFVPLITPWNRLRRKHRFQQFLYCIVPHCCRDVFTAPLHSNGRGADHRKYRFQHILCCCLLICCCGNLYVCDFY